MGLKKKVKRCIKCGRVHNQPGAHCSVCMPEGIKECDNCGKLTPRARFCETCEAHGWLNPTPKVPGEVTPITSGGPAGLDLVRELSLSTIDRYTKHQKIWEELNQIYKDKNRAYGNSFGETFDELGIISAVTRMDDKMRRIKALSKGAENNIKDERLEDTLKDLANYCVMTLIEMGYKHDR